MYRFRPGANLRTKGFEWAIHTSKSSSIAFTGFLFSFLPLCFGVIVWTRNFYVERIHDWWWGFLRLHMKETKTDARDGWYPWIFIMIEWDRPWSELPDLGLVDYSNNIWIFKNKYFLEFLLSHKWMQLCVDDATFLHSRSIVCLLPFVPDSERL